MSLVTCAHAIYIDHLPCKGTHVTCLREYVTSQFSKYIQLQEIINISYYVSHEKFIKKKPEKLTINKEKIPDTFLTIKRTYYVMLHNNDTLTGGGMPCKYYQKTL